MLSGRWWRQGGASTLVALLVGLFLWAVPKPGFSHVAMRSVSNAFIIPHGRKLDYYVAIPPFIGNLLGTGKNLQWYASYFEENFQVSSAGAVCPPTRIFPIVHEASGYQMLHLVFSCPHKVKELDVQDNGLFQDIDPTHTQFIKLIHAGDPHHVLADGILSSMHSRWHVANVAVGNGTLREWIGDMVQFFQLGVMHILTGYDHILFLLSVIVVAESFVQTLKLVTSFTLAHSITLALAYFNVVSLPDRVVEPLIALTIIYVAFENLWAKKFNRRWMLTFSFGLIHGLGFVYTLKEITVSRHELLAALVSFNLGIEGGQLIIVTVALFGLSYLRRTSWRMPVLRTMSLGIGGAGLVWFVARMYALIAYLA
ncbi:MAG: HupE/UreJ family protein [Gammaproteobacteria bacterium]|nr:HupE/UreJ family protein [Gammaproteobacteria bacterium]